MILPTADVFRKPPFYKMKHPSTIPNIDGDGGGNDTIYCSSASVSCSGILTPFLPVFTGITPVATGILPIHNYGCLNSTPCPDMGIICRDRVQGVVTFIINHFSERRQ